MATMNASDVYEPVFTFMEDQYVYTTFNTSLMKNILSIIFTVLGVSIALIGSHFLKRRNLHKLTSVRQEDRIVALTEMTSWLSFGGTFKYILKTRKLPGGRWGFLMIVAGAFSLAHQFFVNSLILDAYIYTADRCTFSSGVITSKFSNMTFIPVTYFSAASTIFSAQVNVMNNGGAFGIWKKFDADSTHFRPYEDEVLGRWLCTEYPGTTINSAIWANANALNTFLDSPDYSFKFPGPYNTADSFNTINGEVQGFVRLSASQFENSTAPWNIRASIANSLDTGIQTAEITNLECDLTTYNNWLPPIMPSWDTINNWVNITYGTTMDSDPSTFGTSLEWIFNQMTMTAGTGNKDIWKVSQLAAGESSFYGCVLRGTSINVGIWVLLILLLAILIPMSIATLVMAISDHRKEKKGGLVDDAPSGVDSWQLALLKQAVKDESLTEKHIGNYAYGWHAGKGNYEINHADTFKAAHASAGLPLQSEHSSTTKQEVGYSSVPIYSPDFRDH